MGGRVRGRRASVAANALAVRAHPYLQARPRRRRVSIVRDDGRVPRLVRGQPPELAGLWPGGLSTRRRRRSGTRSLGTTCGISSWENPARSCWGSRIRRKMPMCSSRGPTPTERRSSSPSGSLGSTSTTVRRSEIRRGKDFVQLKNGPFDLDLIFAPDGIETFEDAWTRRVEVEGFPVCHPDDIIRSKAATNRAKDVESLPRLRAFRDYWAAKRRDL